MIINNFVDSSKSSDRLYKYTEVKYIKSSLDYGIYAGKIIDLNDPYEAKDIKDSSVYRICSLTRSQNANLMWAHYANSHKGCSLQIKWSNYGAKESLLKRVDYKNTYINRRELVSDEEIIESLYCKDDKWKDELEVRAVFSKYSSSLNDWNVSEEGLMFLKAQITAVNFGCMVDINSSEYRDAINCIYEHNKNRSPGSKIRVQKMTMKDDQYRFVVDKNYSFDSELERLGIIEKLTVAS